MGKKKDMILNREQPWVRMNCLTGENRKERGKPTRKKRNLMISKLAGRKGNSFNTVVKISIASLL